MGSVEFSSLIPSMGSGGVFPPDIEHGLDGVNQMFILPYTVHGLGGVNQMFILPYIERGLME